MKSRYIMFARVLDNGSLQLVFKNIQSKTSISAFLISIIKFNFCRKYKKKKTTEKIEKKKDGYRK